MSRSAKRSNSEQTSQRSPVNQNILNPSSDGDISNRRNSRFKNISGSLRGNNSKFQPDSFQVLNASSTVENHNSQWWKDLSDNERVSLPAILRSTAEENKSNNNPPDKNLSQDESDNENNAQNIFPKRSIFLSQEQQSQKSRYSIAFNLNAEVPIEKDEISESQKRNEMEVEELKNQSEENKITESPKLAKRTKKKRRTKSIFSKKSAKQRCYDTAFDNIQTEETQDQEANKDQLVQQDDPADDSNEICKKNPKEKLFKLNLKKKKYSEAFFEAPVEKTPEKEVSVEKTVDVSNNLLEESIKVDQRVTLFKTNVKKKKYSEAFALSKSKLLQDSESDEEINIEEIQTQKDASYTSNRSTRKRKTSVHETLENTPSKETQNTSKRNLKSSTRKSKESKLPSTQKDESESSDGEIYIEDVISQKNTTEISNRNTRKTRSIKSLGPTGSKISQDEHDREENNVEVDETKLDPSQHTRKSQIPNTETEKAESSDEKSITQTKTQKSLLQRTTRNRQNSEEFMDPLIRNTLQDEKHKSQSEKESSDPDEKSFEKSKTKKGLFQRNIRSKQNSEAFLGPSTSQTLQNNNEIFSTSEPDEPFEQSKTQKGLFQRNTRTSRTKYSEAFLGSSTSKILHNDNDKSQSEEEIDEPDEKTIEQSKTKKGLFQRNTRTTRTKYSEAFLGSSTSKSLQNDNDKSQSEEEIDEPDEETIEQSKTQKGLFQRNIRTTRTKYSEAFLGSSTSKRLQNDNDKSLSEEEIDEPHEKTIEQSKTQKGLFQRNTRTTRTKYSEAFLGSSTSKILQNDNDKSQSEKEIDEPDEKTIEQSKTQKGLFQRNTRTTITKYSEAFLGSSTSKPLQNDNDKSQSEKEIDEPDEKTIEQSRTKKGLFQRNTRSKQYSEEFLDPSTSKTLHSDHEESQSEKEGDEPVKVQDRSRKMCPEFVQAENNQTNRVSSQEILPRQRETLDQIISKNTKYSQAFQELLDMQKPTEEEPNNVPVIKIVESNTLDKETAENENVNYTKFSSISSINISNEIKHPLFRPQARRSLYSAKSSDKNNEENQIQSTQEPQQQDIENNNRQKIKTKRLSLRSTSPTESVISKFFDESLISSTKYFINSNEGTGSEGSGKKKKRRSLKSLSENEIDIKKHINKHTPKRTPSRRDRNSKLLSTVNEHPDNILINENKSLIENKIIEENEDIQLDQVKNKNSTSNKGKNSKLSTTLQHPGNEYKIEENQEIQKGKNSKLSIALEFLSNENQEAQSDNQTKHKNSTLKKERKTKSSFAEILKSVSSEKFENDAPENQTHEDNKEQSVPNKGIISSLKRSPKSTTRVSESSVQNKTENEGTTENTDIKQNKILKKKRGRTTQTIFQESHNITPIEQEILTDEKNSQQTEKSAERSKSNIRRTVKSTDDNKVKEVHKEIKDKEINAKVSRKSAVKFYEESDKTSSEEETDAIFIKKSLESIKSRKIHSISKFNLEDNMLESIQEKSLQIESPIQLSSSSSNLKKLSSKFSTDRRTDSQAISGIITINSSLSKARSSDTNQNAENICQSNITNNTRFVENKNSRGFTSNLDIDPVFKKRKFIIDKSSQLCDEKEELERKNILLNAAKNICSKPKKLSPQAPVKKITDFFSKLGKDEKLQPIPKKNKNVKKTVRPVCTARLVDGKPYYKKKLFRGEHWCSEKFYKYIQNKIRNEYGDDTINESENVMRYIVSSVKAVIKSKKYLKKEVDDLKKDLARHGIISTTYDFFCLCFDYLPVEYRDLVVPRTGGVTNVPYDEKDTFKKIKY